MGDRLDLFGVFRRTGACAPVQRKVSEVETVLAHLPDVRLRHPQFHYADGFLLPVLRQRAYFGSGWVSENFTIISFDSVWSLRLLGFFCCAWIGVPSVMFLATGILSNANKDMYEAAKLDGANAFKQFWYLTLPFVLFATTPVVISTFINQFNNFSIFYFLRPETVYAPGYFNANSSDLLINWMYNLTVENRLYSLGSALSLILFAFMAIFSLIAYVMSPAYKKEDTYR